MRAGKQIERHTTDGPSRVANAVTALSTFSLNMINLLKKYSWFRSEYVSRNVRVLNVGHDQTVVGIYDCMKLICATREILSNFMRSENNLRLEMVDLYDVTIFICILYSKTVFN